MAALAALLWAPETPALPAGFEEQEVLTGREGDVFTDFVWTPDGEEMIVVTKAGKVLIFERNVNSFGRRNVALNLSPVLCDNGERGLLGVQLPPEFDKDRYIFLYYTFNKNDNCDQDPFNGPVNRLSRFELPTSGQIDFGTEQVFFETPPLEYDTDNGGAIEFGNDGYLYVTVGDGGSVFGPSSQDASSLLGVVVRLTQDGGIPPSNPYANSTRCAESGKPPEGSPNGTTCEEVYALGVRNPVSLAMDPNAKTKTRFYMNERGQVRTQDSLACVCIPCLAFYKKCTETRISFTNSQHGRRLMKLEPIFLEQTTAGPFEKVLVSMAKKPTVVTTIPI